MTITNAASMKKTWALLGAGINKRFARGHGRDAVFAEATALLSAHGLTKTIAAVGPVFAAGWEAAALSTLEPSVKLAASLMATRVAPDDVKDVKPPWHCFGVDIPPGLLEDGPVFVIALRDIDETFNILGFGESGLFVGREASLAQYAALDLDEKMEVNGEGVGIDDAFARSSEMIGRLIVNLCLELDNPTFRQERAGRKARAPKKGQLTRIETYKVNRKVQVDVRREIRAYVDGTSSKSPTVRSLIRGHWKAQAHGPARALRKRIHVEPYWRGPEEGPVAVRPHVMK